MSEWQGCFESTWTGVLAAEAIAAHPAKFARGLIERIFKFMLAEGMIRRGHTVFDPFGGVGSGGIVAAANGLHWIGSEVEPRFVQIGTDHYARLRPQWETCGDPVPQLLLNDSRMRIADSVQAVVSSPPYNLPMSRNNCGRKNGRRGSKPSDTGAFVPYGNSLYPDRGQIEGLLMPAFWQAATEILQTAVATLDVGGWIAWNVRDFVEHGQIVPMGDEWCRRFESAGCNVRHRIKAMLVSETSHPDLFGGGDHIDRKERKSFFNRVNERKHNLPPIDWEWVLFAQKQ